MNRNMKACAFVLLLSSAISTWSADPGAAAGKQVIDPYGSTNTLPALEAEKKKQLAEAQSWKVFHDFQFDDKYEESGIRFEHHPVDDASKTYMAVHYDHGNG